MRRFEADVRKTKAVGQTWGGLRGDDVKQEEGRCGGGGGGCRSGGDCRSGGGYGGGYGSGYGTAPAQSTRQESPEWCSNDTHSWANGTQA